MVVDFESAKDGELSVKSNGFGKKSFKFDAVFCPQTDQGTSVDIMIIHSSWKHKRLTNLDLSAVCS